MEIREKWLLPLLLLKPSLTLDAPPSPTLGHD